MSEPVLDIRRPSPHVAEVWLNRPDVRNAFNDGVIAALTEDRAALVGEAADLLFHLMVLLVAKNVPLADVMAELDRREGTSGIAEKASRQI